jgi:hypothetical protein
MDCNANPARGKRERDRFSNPPGRAGYQRDLATQVHD